MPNIAKPETIDTTAIVITICTMVKPFALRRTLLVLMSLGEPFLKDIF